MKTYDQECRDSFIMWLEMEGHRLNPEGFRYAFAHQDTMSELSFRGMNLWFNDFREFFGYRKG